jgi:coproporphyrinogen III oxidase
MKEQFYTYIQNLQDQIIAGLEAVDGHAKFRRIFGNVWKVEVVEPGLSKMELFFEGGVNVSAVHGKLPEAMQKLFNVGPIFLPAD